MNLSAATLAALYLTCAPEISPITLDAVIKTESGAHPFKIANITDETSHTFDNLNDAIVFSESLSKENKRYSAGLMQIYSGNFKTLGLTNTTVFDPCENIKAGAKILKENYTKQKGEDSQLNLLKSLSMYYSGNEKTGFKKEKQFRNTSYVERVQKHVYTVPALKPSDNTEPKPSLDKPTESSNQPKQETTQQWDVFGDF